MKIVFQMHRLSQKRKIDEFAKTYVQKKNPFCKINILKMYSNFSIAQKMTFCTTSHITYFIF